MTTITVLGYVSSYVRPVEMGQYHVGDFLTPKCSVIFEQLAKVITSFRYSSATNIWQITLHSSYTVNDHFLHSDGDMHSYYIDKNTNPV
jgi:hypothetical protein